MEQKQEVEQLLEKALVAVCYFTTTDFNNISEFIL